MGAHDGGLFDRTTIDMGETSAGAIAVQQVFKPLIYCEFIEK
jgi:hypothetical protein